MSRAFDPTHWRPIGPGLDPRGTRFQTPFGVVEGRWWPARIQLFHVLPRLQAPASLDLLPLVGDHCDSFGSLPRIGPLPTGPQIADARARDLALQASRWLGPGAAALQMACVLALRALARAHPKAAGTADPGLLVAKFDRTGIVFALASGGVPPGSLHAGLRGWPRDEADRERERKILAQARIRPDALLPALRKLRRIRPTTGTIEALEKLPLALPDFATAHIRLAAFHGVEETLAQAGADLRRLARDNGLPPLVLETP